MIVSDRIEVVGLLDQLELEFQKLVEVVRYADSERALCTKNDPKGFDLILMNARAARCLREVFCGERWEVDDTDNQAGIRNPHINVRVIHCNFDSNACSALVEPTNLVEKGSASRRKVACNRTPWLPGLPIPEQNNGRYTTYVLGTYFGDGGLRAELSQRRFFAARHYSKWVPRIFLLDGSEAAPITGINPVREGPTEVIDIPIKRK